MPELPEVEHVKRGLATFIGRSVSGVQVLWPGTTQSDSLSSIVGKVFTNITRHGKTLFLEFEDIIYKNHLKMTGVWLKKSVREKPISHVRCVLQFHDGSALWFVDIRKFGYFVRATHINMQGWDPMNQSRSSELHHQLHTSRKNIKALLLDQKIVAGIGNIYADELLFRAGVSPLRKANSLRSSQIENLLALIPVLLQQAVDAGGSSLRDYQKIDGSKGSFVQQHKVYGRAGLPCMQCGKALTQAIIASRTTVYCQT